jgi:hypothetical protein
MGYGAKEVQEPLATWLLAIWPLVIWLLDIWTLVIWVHVWQLVISYEYMAIVINYMDKVKFGFLQFGVRTNFMCG